MWFVILEILALVVLSGNEATIERKATCIVGSVVIWYFIIFLYRRWRTRQFINKIYDSAYQNRYDETIAYIDKAIKKRLKIKWFRSENAIIVAFSGDFSLFESLKEQIDIQYINLKDRYKDSSFYSYAVIKYVVSFILGETELSIDASYLNNKKWNRYIKGYFRKMYLAISKYQGKDYDGAIELAQKLNAYKFDFVNFLANLILARSYREKGDNEKVDIYTKQLNQDIRFSVYMKNNNIKV